MTAAVTPLTATPSQPPATLDFALDPANEAHEPPEARGLRRDEVRLLVSDGDTDPVDARFTDLGAFLRAGDVLVVNTSATIAAALDGRLPDGEPVVVHLSGDLPGGVSLVEVREPRDGSTVPRFVPEPSTVELLAGGRVRLLERFRHSRRLWIASLDLGLATNDFASLHGRPIRYRHVAHDWPIGAYRTVFAREPGSAEMPSASRPISHEVVTDLVTRGVTIAPLVLHTGVSSLEGNELPYPERYAVPRTTADAINAARRPGSRVIAAGTTVSRALATVTDDVGAVHPGAGWTEAVITPDRPVRSVDGLLTGWHEPESTHLLVLESFADRETLARAYGRALADGYLWHEFGDSHLLLRPDLVRQDARR